MPRQQCGFHNQLEIDVGFGKSLNLGGLYEIKPFLAPQMLEDFRLTVICLL